MKRKASSVAAPYAKRSRVMNRRIRRSNKISYGSIQRNAIYDLAVTNGATLDAGIALNSQTVQIGGTVVNFQGGADIADMYDAYRIMKVQVSVMYNNNSSNVNQVTYTLPYISSAVDVDDVTTSALSDITQRDDYRCHNFGEGGGFRLVRTFVPKIAPLTYASSTLNGHIEPKAYQWISTGRLPAFTDPLHYGLKLLIEDQNESSVTGVNGYLRFHIKAFFQTKHGQ